MSVRKKESGAVPQRISEDIFEDVIKQNDKVVQFTIRDIDAQVAILEGRIAYLQDEKTKLLTRKSAAEAL